MDIIINFILANYIWILVIAIIIILAIIGWYADKTNFGQGKIIEEKEESIEDLKNELGERKLLDEITQKNQKEESNELLEEKKVDSYKEVINQIELENVPKTNEIKFDPMTGEPLKKVESTNLNIKIKNEKNSKINKVEYKSDNFDKTFDEIIPKKDIMDEDLLGEIDNLTFDKTKKFSIGELPDLSDIDLPHIKQI